MNPIAVRIVRLLAIVGFAMATIAIANHCASKYLASNELTETPLKRSDRIQFLPHDPANLPPPLPPPQLLLIGNSHTYTLPGLNRSQGLRIGAMVSRRILLDELAARLDEANPKTIGSFSQLAYPNFLPYEMLTRVAQLYQHSYKPRLTVIGITWRNVAHDSQVRDEIRQIYRQRAFADAFLNMLKTPAVGASPAVLNAVAADRRRVEIELEKERVRSDADKLDKTMTEWVSDRVLLLGSSADIRARLQLDVMDPIQNAIVERRHKKFDYDLIESDYRFNLDCLNVLLRLLKSNGSQVICYLAPQRTDVPSLMDPAGEEKFNEQLQRETAETGAVVVDARHVVPNEYWGWEYASPDRSHFTEPGHQRLAQFLFEEIERRHLWPPQSQPGR
jgi:hypothetical protein